jgi:hypothetical protein
MQQIEEITKIMHQNRKIIEGIQDFPEARTDEKVT